jgi:hypothetical protein
MIQHRKLALRMRKRVNAMRRWDAEYVDGVKIKYTCRICGFSRTREHKTTPGMARKLAAYQNHGGGATGICPRCTKKSRDELYPLPKKGD